MLVEREKRKIPVRSWVSEADSILIHNYFCLAHTGRLTENLRLCQEETSI